MRFIVYANTLTILTPKTKHHTHQTQTQSQTLHQGKRQCHQQLQALGSSFSIRPTQTWKRKMYQFHSGKIIRNKNVFQLAALNILYNFVIFVLYCIVRRIWDLYFRLFVLLFPIDVLIFGQVKTIIQTGSDIQFAFMVKSLLSPRR